MYFKWYYYLNKLIITGIRFHPSGNINKAVLCVLTKEADGIEISRTTTDKDGRYTFEFDENFLPFDRYVIKFFGEGKSGIIAEEDWERFELIDIKNLPLVFTVGVPNLEVSEVADKKKIDVNNDERTYVRLDFTNLEESQGILSKIVVYYKKSELKKDTDYEKLSEIIIPQSKIDWSWNKIIGVGENNLFRISTLKETGSNYWAEDDLELFYIYFNAEQEYLITNNRETDEINNFVYLEKFIGNGTETNFNFFITIGVNENIKPNTVNIETLDTSFNVIDDGVGNLKYSISGNPAGTVNYDLGTFQLVYSSPLTNNLKGYLTCNTEIVKEPLFVSNGVSVDNTFSLNRQLYKKGTLIVYRQNLSIVGIDASDGYIKDDNEFIVGTIDYESGEGSINIGVPFPIQETISGDYDYENEYKETVLFVKTKELEDVDLTGIISTSENPATITNESGQIKHIEILTLDRKPQDYDFYAIFLNGRDQAAIDSENNIIIARDNNVTLDGIPDLDQMIEALDLRITNLNYLPSEDIDGQGFATTKILKNVFAKLYWQDILKIKEEDWQSNIFKFANGNSVTSLSYEQAQNFIDYSIYQFISNGSDPPDFKRPALKDAEVETKGVWYFIGNLKNSNLDVRNNPGDYIAYWVGFRIKNIEELSGDNIGGDA